MKSISWKQIVPHVVAVCVFLLLTLVYFSPVLEGKDIKQDDAIGSMGWGKDARDYHEETGEYSYWSNSMFSGMPCNYTFAPQPANVFKPIGEVVTLNIFGASQRHIGCIFATFVGCYILFLALGCRPWLSVAGSIVYTLGSYNFIIIDAGHMNKSLVIATMAPVIGGILLCYRRKLLAGSLVTLLFAGLNVYWSHQQVSYYLLLTAVIMAVVYFIYAWREKWLPYYWKATGVLAVVALLAVAPAVGILLPTNDYAKDSMRGGSELSNGGGEEKSSGLNIDYAFDWSYGKAESMTLLVPNLYGSASGHNLGTESQTYTAYKNYVSGAMIEQGITALLQQYPGLDRMTAMNYIDSNLVESEASRQAAQFVASAPTYWGDQPFTSGPVYVGAIVCFLFVLGIFVVKGPEKWWLLAATLFSLVLAWGRNMPEINNFLFEYMPLYNKFRAPSMALVVTTLTMSTLAILAVKSLLSMYSSGKEGEQEKAFKTLYISFGIVGGIALILALFGGSMFSFVSPNDAAMGIDAIPELYSAIIADRTEMLTSDAWRSFVFIAAAAALLFVAGYFRNIKRFYVVSALSLLFLFDMWPVCQRYLNDDKFMPKKETTEIAFTAVDSQIKAMAGDDAHYRVLNLAGNTFNEAFTSYKHSSIGGYSPAKLSRYQDLINVHLSQMNFNVISMLNTRFIITEQGVVENLQEYGLPGAYGNCWLVDNVEWVSGAQEEIEAITAVDKQTAYIDKAWLGNVENPEQYNNSQPGTITMTQYKGPGNIIYESNCDAPKIAVFSEVYYKTWKAFIDGKEVTPLRANYVLRALPLPAGKHTIEFKCVDELMIESHKWSLYLSIFVGVVMVAAVAFGIYRKAKR